MKKNYLNLVIIMIGIFMIQNQITAQNINQNNIHLSWPEILKKVQHDPRIKSSLFQRQHAKEGIHSATSFSNPMLQGNLSQGESLDKSTSKLEWGLSISIPLNPLIKKNSKKKVAISKLHVQEHESKAIKLDVIFKIHTLFFKLLAAQDHVRILEKLQNEFQKLHHATQLRVISGDARSIEELQIKIEFEALQAELKKAQAHLISVQFELASWLNLKKKKIIAKGDLSSFKTSLLNNKKSSKTHPLIRASSARTQMFTSLENLERQKRLPSISLQLFTEHELDRRAYGAGINMELPLWNWNSPQIKQASLLKSIQQENEKRIIIQIKNKRHQSRIQCKMGRHLSKQYQKKILPQINQASSLLMRSYELGESSLFELINAQRTRLRTQEKYNETLLLAQIECARYQSLLGEE